MNNIQNTTALERIFHYRDRRLRTLQRDGQHWFVVIDVCEALEICNTRDAISRLASDDVGLIELVDARGRRQRMRIINEAGLYTLVLSSRKPEAKAFGHWVTHEVLPSLRRSGVYRMPDKPAGERKAGQLALGSRRLLNLALDASLECDRLRQENELLRPKAEFYDAVADGGDSFSFGETAKLIGLPGCGRNNLIRFLRARGILMAGNIAKQRYVDRGYFRVVQSGFAAADGTLHVKAVTRVREKGVEFIRRQLTGLQRLLLESGS